MLLSGRTLKTVLPYHVVSPLIFRTKIECIAVRTGIKRKTYSAMGGVNFPWSVMIGAGGGPAGVIGPLSRHVKMTGSHLSGT